MQLESNRRRLPGQIVLFGGLLYQDMRLPRGIDKRFPGDLGRDIAVHGPAACAQRRTVFQATASRQWPVSNSTACCALEICRIWPAIPTEITTGLENHPWFMAEPLMR